MTPGSSLHFDTHQKPPENMRLLFRRLQKSHQPFDALSNQSFDFDALSDKQLDSLLVHNALEPFLIHTAFSEFLNDSLGASTRDQCVQQPIAKPQMFEFRALPGLFIMPKLFPPQAQIALLNKLLHRDLSNPAHKTNLHFHHEVLYPSAATELCDEKSELAPDQSFFSLDPEIHLEPKDASTHRPLTMRQVLQKKLRWITLGGQYDWTEKVYPSEKPPPFPEDISRLLERLFPNVKAQAAIVNLYSTGDTLSVHRDISEQCDRELISISVGCDAIFIVGIDGTTDPVAIRLHSGDALVMSGPSRFAWHAVPKIELNTCPEWLQDWPATLEPGQRYDQYSGWMKNKRINLNVRQITDERQV